MRHKWSWPQLCNLELHRLTKPRIFLIRAAGICRFNVQSLSTMLLTSEVSRMFYTYSLESVTSYRIVTAEARSLALCETLVASSMGLKAYPQNFDVSVEYLSSPAPVILGFSVAAGILWLLLVPSLCPALCNRFSLDQSTFPSVLPV